MVEVPLSEVMRHVDVQGLRRRPDQRRVELPKSAPALFGDSSNPYVMAPSFSDGDELEEAPSAVENHTNGHAAEEATEMEDEAPLFRMAPRSTPAPAPAMERAQPPAFPAPAAVASRQAPLTASPAPVAGPALHGTLTLALADVCGAWPEPIRSEAIALGDVQVAIPADLVAGGLAKGKLAFSWGQIRSYITPTPIQNTEGREGAELLLPLKVVAPAFMALSKPASRRKTVELDETIPDMFGGNGVPAADSAAEAALPVEVEAPAPVESAPEPAPAAAAPKVLKFVLNEDSVSAAPEPEPAEAPEAHPPVAAPAAAATHAQTIGELFGAPQKASWSVHEIIEATAKLPGVAGAVLALQEGLPVAASLPGDLKGETMAAFIPQIFARLNVYAGEMKLAAVDEILMTTNGAHFQAYRLGQVYFAVLGQPGNALPWEALRIVVDELVKQSPA
jgi:predicted regulator of Ras-like GTPase activity (Roadblock/LC7/MglB family)